MSVTKLKSLNALSIVIGFVIKRGFSGKKTGAHSRESLVSTKLKPFISLLAHVKTRPYIFNSHVRHVNFLALYLSNLPQNLIFNYFNRQTSKVIDR